MKTNKILVYFHGQEAPQVLGDMAWLVHQGKTSWEKLVQAMELSGHYEFIWDEEGENNATS